MYVDVKADKMDVHQLMLVIGPSVSYLSKSFDRLRKHPVQAIVKDLLLHCRSTIEFWAPDSIRARFPEAATEWTKKTTKSLLIATVRDLRHGAHNLDDPDGRHRLDCAEDAVFDFLLAEIMQAWEEVLTACKTAKSKVKTTSQSKQHETALRTIPKRIEPILSAYEFKKSISTNPGDAYFNTQGRRPAAEIQYGAARTAFVSDVSTEGLRMVETDPRFAATSAASLLRAHVEELSEKGINAFTQAAYTYLTLKSFEVYKTTSTTSTYDLSKMAKDFADECAMSAQAVNSNKFTVSRSDHAEVVRWSRF